MTKLLIIGFLCTVLVYSYTIATVLENSVIIEPAVCKYDISGTKDSSCKVGVNEIKFRIFPVNRSLSNSVYMLTLFNKTYFDRHGSIYNVSSKIVVEMSSTIDKNEYIWKFLKEVSPGGIISINDNSYIVILSNSSGIVPIGEMITSKNKLYVLFLSSQGLMICEQDVLDSSKVGRCIFEMKINIQNIDNLKDTLPLINVVDINEILDQLTSMLENEITKLLRKYLIILNEFPTDRRRRTALNVFNYNRNCLQGIHFPGGSFLNIIQFRQNQFRSDNDILQLKDLNYTVRNDRNILYKENRKCSSIEGYCPTLIVKGHVLNCENKFEVSTVLMSNRPVNRYVCRVGNINVSVIITVGSTADKIFIFKHTQVNCLNSITNMVSCNKYDYDLRYFETFSIVQGYRVKLYKQKSNTHCFLYTKIKNCEKIDECNTEKLNECVYQMINSDEKGQLVQYSNFVNMYNNEARVKRSIVEHRKVYICKGEILYEEVPIEEQESCLGVYESVKVERVFDKNINCDNGKIPYIIDENSEYAISVGVEFFKRHVNGDKESLSPVYLVCLIPE